MTDKVQKIREEVVWLMSNHDSALDYEAALEDVLNIIDSMQEEPVSEIDFEQELYKAFGHVKDFALGMQIAKWFYSMGKNSQEPVSEEWIKELRTKLDSLSKEDFKKVFDKYAVGFNEEPVSEDLEEAADKYESEQQEKYKDRDNHDFDNYRDGFVDGLTHTYEAFMSGAKWRKGHLWKPADGDDLPEYDKEVIAILDYDFGHYKVVYAHRPNPNGWNGTNIDTGEKEHFEPEIYDKGGWNQPHVLYWLDARLPYEEK